MNDICWNTMENDHSQTIQMIIENEKYRDMHRNILARKLGYLWGRVEAAIWE